VLAVGDAEFQKKCLGKMEDVSKGGRTVLFVSHNMDAVIRLCSQAILLRKGQCVATGSAREIISQYTMSRDSQPAKIILKQSTEFYTRQNLVLQAIEWPKATVPWILPFGEPISFSVAFECRKPVKNVELGIALYAPSGTEIASTSSISTRSDIHLQPGQYKYDVCYRALNLVPNHYGLGLGLKSDFGQEDYIPRAFSLDVVPSAKSSAAKTDTFAGYIVPDVSYELQKTD
jgi:lipopolysaccharide transport system ATP-binding protein